MSAYFVTATGTDVGKTFVTAALCARLRLQGRPVHALKPVLSGYEPARAEHSDVGVLLRSLGRPVDEAEIERVCPWRFAAPLSPDMAAAREGRTIDFDRLVVFCRAALPADPKALLFIEGVGGVAVPLDATHTVLHWMRALRLPVLLVAGTYLGTISHTLTALDSLRLAGIEVRALVLNESLQSPVPVEETAATLARFAPDLRIAHVPRSTRTDGWRPTSGAPALDALTRLLD